MPTEYDTSVPVLLFKIGRYTLSHGSLGAIRSLSGVGVSVFAIVEDRFVPHALSRRLAGRFVVEFATDEPSETILEALRAIAAQLGSKVMLLPTDDEAATFVAEQGEKLRRHFIIPAVAANLPRLMASKWQLSQSCIKHGIPTPRTVYAASAREARAFAEAATFPLVVKNSEPWTRISAPAVSSSTVVRSRESLNRLIASWTAEPQVILQEYIPPAVAEDWIFHGYFDAHADAVVAFSGRKERAWPPTAGVTSSAIAVPNEPLVALATRFCKTVGYQGIVDMDWRFDRRDSQYKLLDCNPRLGANFRLFMTEAGIDVVRAQHLDLTGRPVPRAQQVFGRRFIVENLDFASRFVGSSARQREAAPNGVEYAWFAVGDVMPFLGMLPRFVGNTLGRIVGNAVRRGIKRIVHPQKPREMVPVLPEGAKVAEGPQDKRGPVDER